MDAPRQVAPYLEDQRAPALGGYIVDGFLYGVGVEGDAVALAAEHGGFVKGGPFGAGRGVVTCQYDVRGGLRRVRKDLG